MSSLAIAHEANFPVSIVERSESRSSCFSSYLLEFSVQILFELLFSIQRFHKALYLKKKKSSYTNCFKNLFVSLQRDVRVSNTFVSRSLIWIDNFTTRIVRVSLIINCPLSFDAGSPLWCRCVDRVVEYGDGVDDNSKFSEITKPQCRYMVPLDWNLSTFLSWVIHDIFLACVPWLFQPVNCDLPGNLAWCKLLFTARGWRK